jgi:hypothetical protein
MEEKEEVVCLEEWNPTFALHGDRERRQNLCRVAD